MKTRYSSLVSVKKNIMQKSEQVLQKANLNLNNAKAALKQSLQSLQEITAPKSGQISEFLANRTLLDSQRSMIKHNEEWVAYVKREILEIKEQLKYDMIEYEKFKYLEVQEIQKILKEEKIKEAKDLDEVALMTHTRKVNIEQAS